MGQLLLINPVCNEDLGFAAGPARSRCAPHIQSQECRRCIRLLIALNYQWYILQLYFMQKSKAFMGIIMTNPAVILPSFIRLDAATACQLKCPACPTGTGETGKRLGSGFLEFDDFRKLLDKNPWVSHIELSNWGEIFLNRDILRILAYAFKRNVALYAGNGANLNTVGKDVLQGMVKYKLRRLTCSIDGASQETYVKYRVNGNFNTVIDNIKTINHWKAEYRSEFPKLHWSYIAFGHNEHEISKARHMAGDLNMEFNLKLAWDDLYTEEFSPVINKKLIRKESG